MYARILRFAGMFCLGLALPAAQQAIAAGTPDVPPDWAYPTPQGGQVPPPDNGLPRYVPGSRVSYTASQVRDVFTAPQWHPEDSPALPPVVARGRKPEFYACGFCHRADGPGGPENASIRGLPADYIIEQLNAFRSGERRSALPQRVPFAQMALAAKGLTAEEMREVAAYYSALPPRRVIRVVEAVSIPRPRSMGWFYAASQTGEWESLAGRIIEVPVDVEQFENRDARAQFLAYVPLGSLSRGEQLVRRSGPDRGLPCTGCHGPELRGVANVPSIAGRSPSYIFRQLFDIRAGARAGVAVQPMQAPVARLSMPDMVDMAAYLASLAP